MMSKFRTKSKSILRLEPGLRDIGDKKTKTGLKSLLVFLMVSVMMISVFSCAPNIVQKNTDLNNMGYTLLDNNDLYYTKVVVKDYMYYYSCLYKRNLKTGEDTLINIQPADNLNEVNAFINIMGNQVYFLPNYVYDSVGAVSDNIMKVKKSGVNPTELFNDVLDCSLIQVVGNTIYYYDDVEQTIYKTDKNGKKVTEICEASTTSMFVQGNKIYFSEFDYIFEVSTSGGEPRIVFDASEEGYFIEQIAYNKGYIYFGDDTYSCIRRVKANSKEATESELIYEVSSQSSAYIERFSIYKDVVYFVVDSFGSDENYAILSVPATLGNNSPRAVVSDSSDFIEISPFSIWNDTIYFYAMTSGESILDSDWVWYTVPISGGTVTPFAPLNVFDDSFIAPGDEIEEIEEDEEDEEEEDETDYEEESDIE